MCCSPASSWGTAQNAGGFVLYSANSAIIRTVSMLSVITVRRRDRRRLPQLQTIFDAGAAAAQSNRIHQRIRHSQDRARPVAGQIT